MRAKRLVTLIGGVAFVLTIILFDLTKKKSDIPNYYNSISFKKAGVTSTHLKVVSPVSKEN